MAKTMTFSEAVSRFESLVTTGITIQDAIQEAVNRIYEMGRWPGTTEELALADGDFTKEDDEWFLYLDETDYDGMIGFRNKSRGWSIMDQTILYRDGVNGGDLSLVDFGPVDVTENNATVSKRRYRMPLNFSLDNGPYFALMKLEPPTFDNAAVIPVYSVGALKCAILAVSYEFVSDEERAQFNWQKFEQLMESSSREVEGPKKYYIGFDSSLRRKPKQFM